MMSTADEIEDLLRSRLDAESINVIDESQAHAGHEGAKGGGGHYAVTVVSPKFIEQNTMRRHRMVYEALAELMSSKIHALSIRALSPDEL